MKPTSVVAQVGELEMEYFSPSARTFKVHEQYSCIYYLFWRILSVFFCCEPLRGPSILALLVLCLSHDYSQALYDVCWRGNPIHVHPHKSSVDVVPAACKDRFSVVIELRERGDGGTYLFVPLAPLSPRFLISISIIVGRDGASNPSSSRTR